MAEDNLKIIIPMAGFGTRLRPHTWSKPKPLISAAGKAVLAHVLDILKTMPDFDNAELVFIVGYLGEQVEAFMQENYPHIKAHFVEQAERRGQSHAIAMARQYVSGPTLIAFVDTIIDTNLDFLKDETAGAVIWVKPVEDPRRFGVAEVDQHGWVQSLVEKPEDVSNNLAVVGFYYFASGEDLMAAIDEQMARDIQLKGEYFLAGAMTLMLEKGLKMRAQPVEMWLDAGLPETVLQTNRYLLDNGRDNSDETMQRNGITVIPPVYVDPSAIVEDSTIGPHASIGAGCQVRGSKVRDSVLEPEARVIDAELDSSLIGARAEVQGLKGIFNIGDDSVVSKPENVNE